MPDKMTRRTFADHLRKKALQPTDTDNFSITYPVFSEMHGNNHSTNRWVRRYLRKVFVEHLVNSIPSQEWNAASTSEKALRLIEKANEKQLDSTKLLKAYQHDGLPTQADHERFKLLSTYGEKLHEYEHGFHVSIGGVPSLPNPTLKTYQFMVDPSFRPWHRGVEIITPVLKDKTDYKVAKALLDAAEALQPQQTKWALMTNFLKDCWIQLGHRFSLLPNDDESGLELGKPGAPGYQGKRLTSSGYGSVHLHHDTSHYAQYSPIILLNELKLFKSVEDFLIYYMHPGASRIKYVKPVDADFIKALEDLLRNSTHLSKDEQWEKTALLFSRYFTEHQQTKYRSLNITNTLGPFFHQLKQNKPSLAKNLPHPIQGFLGKKASKKTTAELRLLSSTLNSKEIFELNTFFQNMAIKAKAAADKNQILNPPLLQYNPIIQDQQMNQFVQYFSLPERPLNKAIWKTLKKSAFDAKLFDDLLANNWQEPYRLLSYTKLTFAGLKHSLPEIFRYLRRQIGLDTLTKTT
jgi:hypothetical protein